MPKLPTRATVRKTVSFATQMSASVVATAVINTNLPAPNSPVTAVMYAVGKYGIASAAGAVAARQVVAELDGLVDAVKNQPEA